MSIRGTALVETAFVMSLVLMVLFASFQLAVLAFTQTSQDGAAFVAARAYAENPSAGAAPAEAAAHKIFSHVPVSAFVLTPVAGQVAVGVTGTGNGLPVPGTPASFGLSSIASEPVAPAAGAGFSVSDTLQNYFTSPGDNYAVGGLLQSRPILVAQTFGSVSGSRYAEWYCRQAVYAALVASIPNTTANGANNCYFWWFFGCFFDPMRFSSPLDPIYDWDTGGTCV